MSHFTVENQPRVPEPALVRGFILTITAVISFFLQKQIDVSWIDALLTVYTFVAPLIAGILIRRKVAPESEVRLRVQRALYTEPPTKAA